MYLYIFLIKAVYDVLPIPVDLYALGEDTKLPSSNIFTLDASMHKEGIHGDIIKSR